MTSVRMQAIVTRPRFLQWGAGSSRGKLRRSVSVAAAPSDVFLIGLENVLVKTSSENLRSSGRAAAKLFPDRVPETILNDTALLEAMTERTATLAPWQIITLFKKLGEDGQWSPDHVRSLDVQKAWAEPATEQWTQEYFACQEAEMDRDAAQWLEGFEVFVRIEEALKECPYPFYLVSEQSPKAASAILKNHLKQEIDPDSPRLFLAPSDSRIPTLHEVQSRPLCQETGARLHFIESSLDGLKRVSNSPEFSRWKLYLASWGGVTEAQVAEAKAAGIVPIALADFRELLKWGILMGVDDGCEPTVEEVQVGVKDSSKRSL